MTGIVRTDLVIKASAAFLWLAILLPRPEHPCRRPVGNDTCLRHLFAGDASPRYVVAGYGTGLLDARPSEAGVAQRSASDS